MLGEATDCRLVSRVGQEATGRADAGESTPRLVTACLDRGQRRGDTVDDSSPGVQIRGRRDLRDRLHAPILVSSPEGPPRRFRRGWSASHYGARPTARPGCSLPRSPGTRTGGMGSVRDELLVCVSQPGLDGTRPRRAAHRARGEDASHQGGSANVAGDNDPRHDRGVDDVGCRRTAPCRVRTTRRTPKAGRSFAWWSGP
jgi:hypothetical protein